MASSQHPPAGRLHPCRRSCGQEPVLSVHDRLAQCTIGGTNPHAQDLDFTRPAGNDGLLYTVEFKVEVLDGNEFLDFDWQTGDRIGGKRFRDRLWFRGDASTGHVTLGYLTDGFQGDVATENARGRRLGPPAGANTYRLRRYLVELHGGVVITRVRLDVLHEDGAWHRYELRSTAGADGSRMVGSSGIRSKILFVGSHAGVSATPAATHYRWYHLKVNDRVYYDGTASNAQPEAQGWALRQADHQRGRTRLYAPLDEPLAYSLVNTDSVRRIAADDHYTLTFTFSPVPAAKHEALDILFFNGRGKVDAFDGSFKDVRAGRCDNAGVGDAPYAGTVAGGSGYWDHLRVTTSGIELLNVDGRTTQVPFMAAGPTELEWTRSGSRVSLRLNGRRSWLAILLTPMAEPT